MKNAVKKSVVQIKPKARAQYSERITISLHDGGTEVVIIPPIMKTLLKVIASNENMTVKRLCYIILYRKQKSLKSLDALHAFIKFYIGYELEEQCHRCSKSK